MIDLKFEPPQFYVAPPQEKDVIQVVLSDMHSGSNYALFVNYQWQGTKGNNHTATNQQLKIRTQFEKYAAEIRQLRQGKKIKLVHNGDAIDGDHHHSGDVCTLNLLDQANIHVELIQEFQQRIDWQAGDELYYTRGTQTHVNEFENYIGEKANAIPDGDFYVHEFLQLETNGRMSWFAHHGPTRGDGDNEGNSMRNWLRNIKQEAIKDKQRVPDIIYTSHVHYPTYSPYAWREKMEFRLMHGIITPTWQLKTSFGWQVASMKQAKIGGMYQEVKADGTIAIPVFSVMDAQ